MKSFINSLSKYLIAEHSDLSSVVVVFPNRRPGVFLARELGLIQQTPFFSPSIFSIRDFIYEHSHLNQSDNITLLFTLYHIYSKINDSEGDYEFEHFLKSGELMLADFNDIDNYMVHPEQLFSNLDQAKAIELWNPGMPDLTEGEKQYLAFFQKLYRYYEAFKKELISNKTAYDGMAYRHMAEQIQEGEIFANPNRNYVFAGFNALNNAEKIIIDHFVKHSGAVLFWDADEAYLNDIEQEAGAFLRENISEWGMSKCSAIENLLLTSKKNIRIIGAPLSLSQAKYAGQIAAQLHAADKEQLNNTVIVPADESSLPAVLESLPNDIEHINVTMGYPLKNSLIYEIIGSYIRLFVRSHKSISKGKALRMYYYELIVFVRHPLFKNCFENCDPGFGHALSSSILRSNRLYYSADDLNTIIASDAFLKKTMPLGFSKFFEELISPMQLTSRCISICNTIEENIEENDSMQAAMTAAMGDVLLLLGEYMEKAGFEFTFNGFEMLFGRLAGGVQVPFEGEPLGGLQLMGFLETRCLDFKNVIFTGFNEGLIPSGGKRMQTFIPFDLRRSFGMPMPSHKDAMYSYYFLRLLQRAENIWILHNTEPDALSGKEVSRFVKQIEYEFKLKAGDLWNVSNSVLQIFPSSKRPDKLPEGAEKTQLVSDLIEKRIHKGYSASRLYNYVECPYRYYLRYVLDIQEPESDVAESVEMNTLGTVVHETLKILYENFKNIILDNKFFTDCKAAFPRILEEQFALNYVGGNMNEGKNLIIGKVAERMVLNVLNADQKIAKDAELIPLIIEDDIEGKVKVGDKEFAIFGKFDRVDKVGQTVRIADYKTGKTDSLQILKKGMEPDVFEMQSLDSKQFQLLFYLLLFRCTNKTIQLSNDLPLAGIISLKKNNIEFSAIEFSDKVKEIPLWFLDNFETYVSDIIAELHNPQVPFYCTENIEKCTFCVYSSVCSYFSTVRPDKDEEN